MQVGLQKGATLRTQVALWPLEKNLETVALTKKQLGLPCLQMSRASSRDPFAGDLGFRWGSLQVVQLGARIYQSHTRVAECSLSMREVA